MKKFQITSLALGLSVILSGCIAAKRAKTDKSGGTNYETSFKPWSLKEDFWKDKSVAQVLSGLRTKNNLNGLAGGDLFWSLSQCDQCLPNYSSQLLAQMITQKGVLPQPLVPVVREEINGNPILKALFASPLGGIGKFLGGLFLNDQKITENIRKSLSEKIAKSYPTNIQSSIPWRFDLFADPSQVYKNVTPQEFNISDQAGWWSQVMSVGYFWDDENSFLLNGDHGFQVVLISKVLAEWSYLFGIETNGYGGLAFDPTSNVDLGIYDPRIKLDPAKIVSGKYKISYPNGSQLSLAIDVKEEWSRTNAPYTLGEQALILSSAASAYMRLKPSHRKAHTQNLFRDVIPSNSHEMSFVFLAGLSKLLNGILIDLETRTIFETVNPNTPAKLESLVRLARGVNMWLLALENYEQDQLDAQIKKMVSQNIATMKDVLRLSVQAIFENYIDNFNEDSKTISFYKGTSLEASAEAIATLLWLDQSQFEVPSEIKIKLVSLVHWFVAFKLKETPTNNPLAILWSVNMLNLFANYDESTRDAVWLNSLSQYLKNELSSFDEGVK